MLLIGPLECIPDIPINVLNLSSFKEGLDKVNLLPPTNGELPFIDDKEFDISYANYIMSNDYTFMELMKIIMPLYLGQDVYLVITDNPLHNSVIESLTKFIQVRYGYVTQYIHCVDDLEFIDKDVSFNNIQGIYNLDIDKERYSRLIAPSLMRNGEIHYGE